GRRCGQAVPLSAHAPEWRTRRNRYNHPGEILTGPLETHFIAYANRTARGGTFSDSVFLANRCSKRPNGHSDGVRIYRTYRPMNGQPMLPKWPNDGSSHMVREEPGKQKPRSCRAQELARSSAQETAWQKKHSLPKSVRIARKRSLAQNGQRELREG